MGRLLCPLQLPDKNTACLLWMHCKRVGCHCTCHAHAGTHTHTRCSGSGVPHPGEREGAGRLSPGPLPGTCVCCGPASQRTSEALPAKTVWNWSKGLISHDSVKQQHRGKEYFLVHSIPYVSKWEMSSNNYRDTFTHHDSHYDLPLSEVGKRTGCHLRDQVRICMCGQTRESTEVEWQMGEILKNARHQIPLRKPLIF